MKRFWWLLLLPALVHPQNLGNPYASYLNLVSKAKVSGQQLAWPGGIGVFMCVGTWAGATATLQFVGPDNVTLVSAGTATTLTANGAGVFYLPSANIQATITNAGTTTSLTCAAGAIPAPNTA